MKKITLFMGAAILCSGFIVANLAVASTINQSVDLNPGWNIVSTPRVVESHSFTASEIATNFDIFVLNASSTAGWSTMAELGQTEFMPLFGYFIKNKTSSTQQLTFDYKDITSPSERLFERKFSKAGWYSIGIASPTYAKSQLSGVSDTDNVANVLDSLAGYHSSVIDFTSEDFPTIPSSVRVGDTWKAVVAGDLNTLDDLRDTKGYAVYLTKENALFSGFQNTDYQPGLTEISPSVVPAGTGNFALTVKGWNFTPSSTVKWDGSDRATTFSSSTQISAAIPSSDVSAPTTVKITVSNPMPNGGVSPEAGLVVGAVSSISLGLAPDSPSTAIPGSTNVVLAKYDLVPSGENYELRQISFGISQTSVALTGTVYVKVNGATVYSEGASAWASAGTARTITLSSYPILTAGTNNTITVEGSVNSTATASDSYQVIGMDLIQVKRLVTGDFIDPNLTSVNGLVVGVLSAKLAVTTLPTPVASSVVGGTNSYEYATFQLNAQSGGEDVKVTTVVVTHSGGTLTDVSNLYIYKDSETSPLTTTASTATNAATVTFSLSSPITVTRATPVTLHLKADALTGSTSIHSYSIASTSGHIVATGVSTGNSLTHGTDITFAGSGQAMTHVAAGTLTLSLVSGTGASPSTNQIATVGATNGVYYAFKMTSQYEMQKITSLKIYATTTGITSLATTTLTNIRLYEGTSATPFVQASQFDACDAGQCAVTFTASDNLLLAPVPVTGVTIYVKADIGVAGSAYLGDNFKFLISSSTTDITVKGSVTGSTLATRTGNPSASGITYVVPQSVVISAVTPLSATDVGTGSGQNVGVFKITNNGSAPIYLASTTMTFANGGSATTSLKFDMSASAMGGGQSDVSIDYPTSTTGTTGASSTVAFNFTAISAANRKIDGGSWRYITVKTSGAAANNNTFQFSVSVLGNILFSVDEADIGYSGNGDADLMDTITNLYVDGTPSLGSVTAKN